MHFHWLSVCLSAPRWNTYVYLCSHLMYCLEILDVLYVKAAVINNSISTMGYVITEMCGSLSSMELHIMPIVLVFPVHSFFFQSALIVSFSVAAAALFLEKLLKTQSDLPSTSRQTPLAYSW